MGMQLKQLLNRVPFGLMVPLFYVLYFASIFVFMLLWPFVLLYGFVILCPLLWITWGRRGTDVLLVVSNAAEARDWSARIVPLIGYRAVLLDYDQVDQWSRWSVASQLFGIFGPQPIPEIFMRYSLPAAIVIKQWQWPKRFVFGSRSKDRELLLDQLRAELSR